MTKEELYLKTVFCCMTCDGDIAEDEANMMRELCARDSLFSGLDVESLINNWIQRINENGARFLQSFLDEIPTVDLSEQEQLLLVKLAINTIEADNRIEYSEIKFFKKIRSRLSVSDERILSEFPDKEDYLLPDINVSETPKWDESILFAKLF